MKKTLILLTFFFLILSIAGAKKLKVVTGDVSLIEDGIVFEGSESQLPQKDEWRFPISVEGKELLIQARLFWGDTDADLGLLVKFKSGFELEVDRATTTSEFIQFKLFDQFDSFIVRSNPPEPSQLKGGYYLRCLLRTQREEPSSVDKVEGVIPTGFKPSENIQTFNTVRDKAAFFKVNIEKRAIFYVVLEPLENLPVDIFDLKIYEFDSGKRGRLRQEPLYTDRDKSGRLECIFDVETPGQFLVQVKFRRGQKEAAYEISLDLFAKNTDEKPRQLEKSDISGSVFQLKKSRPWKYNLIGKKIYSQSRHSLSSSLLNPGKIYLDFRPHRGGKLDLKDVELILEPDNPNVSLDRDEMTISINAAPPENETLEIIFSPECKDRRLVDYVLFLKQVPEWKDGKTREIKYNSNSSGSLNFFKKRSDWWEYQARRRADQSVVLKWEKSSDVDLELEVFTEDTNLLVEDKKKIFYSRAETRQELQTGFEKFCTFTHRGKIYFRVTLNTRTSEPVKYRIKLGEAKGESNYPNIVEAEPNKSGTFKVESKLPTYLLVHAFPKKRQTNSLPYKSEAKYKLEVIEDEIKLEFLETMYGSFYEWAIPFKGQHRFRIQTRPDELSVRYLVVRNRKYEYPTCSEEFSAWKNAQEEFISTTNDDFICAENIMLNGDGMVVKGQLHSGDLADYWKIITADRDDRVTVNLSWRTTESPIYKTNENYGFKVEIYDSQGKRIKGSRVGELSFFYIAVINLEDGITKNYEIKLSTNLSESEENFEIFVESKI